MEKYDEKEFELMLLEERVNFFEEFGIVPTYDKLLEMMGIDMKVAS